MPMRLIAVFFILVIFALPAHAASKRVVVLGDSLTSGYGLQGGEDLPAKLQEKLIADGLDVKIENAGVSGDTTAGGKARLDWSIQGDQKPDLVIVALGANDMLRGIDPATTRQNLTDILDVLKAKNMQVLLVGMKAPMNMGDAYRAQFEVIYDDLAQKYKVPHYPFFLDGVAMNADLNQGDGMHPNTKGVAVIVQKMSPVITKLLKNSK